MTNRGSRPSHRKYGMTHVEDEFYGQILEATMKKGLTLYFWLYVIGSWFVLRLRLVLGFLLGK